MTDSQCVDYLENICKMFVNGSKNCEGQALEYQQMYISAIRHAISKLQSGADMWGVKKMNNDLRYYGNPMNWEGVKGDLISRSALKEAIKSYADDQYAENEYLGECAIIAIIDNAPTVEYTFEAAFQKTVCDNKLYCPSRPQGKWIIIDDTEKFIAKCSVCGRIEDSRMIKDYPFCHCGADMRGNNNENL